MDSGVAECRGRAIASPSTQATSKRRRPGRRRREPLAPAGSGRGREAHHLAPPANRPPDQASLGPVLPRGRALGCRAIRVPGAGSDRPGTSRLAAESDQRYPAQEADLLDDLLVDRLHAGDLARCRDQRGHGPSRPLRRPATPSSWPRVTAFRRSTSFRGPAQCGTRHCRRHETPELGTGGGRCRPIREGAIDSWTQRVLRARCRGRPGRVQGRRGVGRSRRSGCRSRRRRRGPAHVGVAAGSSRASPGRFARPGSGGQLQVYRSASSCGWLLPSRHWAKKNWRTSSLHLGTRSARAGRTA